MESNNNDFKKIKYGEKEYFVVDVFEYKGRKYFFIVEDFYVEGKEKIEDYTSTRVEANFIYKVYDHYFDNVTDDRLYKELFGIVTKRILLKQNHYFKDMYNQKKEA